MRVLVFAAVVAAATGFSSVASASASASASTAPRLTSAVPPPECAAPPGAPHVVLFGDSLGAEAKSRFLWELQCGAKLDVEVLAQPGAALCDFREVFAEYTTLEHVDIAVMEFTQNNRTECVKDAAGVPLQGSALLARYRADALAATIGFVDAGTRVVWVTPPGFTNQTELPMRAVFEDVAHLFGGKVSIVDGGRELRDNSGVYREFLPCLPSEVSLTSCWNGFIRVRMPVDGFHLCPVLKSGPCPYYSSGATRLARVMASGVRQALQADARGASQRRTAGATARRPDRVDTRGDRSAIVRRGACSPRSAC